MKIIDLRCEYLISPSCVGVNLPRLSWRLVAEDGERGCHQTAYRVLVASSEEKLTADEGDLWDSGIIQSPETTQIYYSGSPLADRQRCLWKVRVFNGDAETEWSETACWRMGISDWTGKFIGYNRPISGEELVPPLAVGKRITVEKGLECATLYITALGLYDVHIGGNELTGAVLAPEWTNYKRRVQYRAFNVTEMLREGGNDMTVLLANGWYSGIWQFWPPHAHPYGIRPQLRAQIELEYSDGHREIIPTDASWCATEKVPVTFAGIYEGENIDGRIPLPSYADMELPVTEYEHGELKICPQTSEPITVFRKITAKTVSEPRPGVYVADLGENIAGRASLHLHGASGTTVTAFHNEVLAADGTVYDENLVAGHFVSGVDRQMLRYTFRGDAEGEIIRPTFTYMGFRYIELRGLSYRPMPEDIAAEVFGSAVCHTASFGCSDEDINRLQENIIRSSRANFMGVPTDCPQRDERCGYTGDMQFFMPTALDNFNMAAFMTKWLTDLCEDSQLNDGSFTDHAPMFGQWSGNVGWGDAGIICPYLTWREYGDREIVKRHFAAMERYMTYLTSTANPDFTRGPEFCGNGDWLHTGGGASNEIIATTYYAYDARLMAEMAETVGEKERAEYYSALAANIQTAFAEKYINSDGSITGGGVTGYALAFTMDLLPHDEKLRRGCAEAFAAAVEATDCRITTGFIGTPRLLPALHIIGRDDLAERLLTRRDCPSWLYPVTVGATTVWERFDGWTEEHGFASSGMNSFNHFAFGSVGNYFYRCILGINQPDCGGNERTVRVSPVYLKCLTEAHGNRRVFGSDIAVSWKRVVNGIRLTVDVGANIRAAVTVNGVEILCECGSYDFSITE